MENKTLMTDFYEFTMDKTFYENNGSEERTCYNVFFRKNPFAGGYTISVCLDNIINFIKNIKITDEDIKYLKKLNRFSDDFLNSLKDFKFNGDIYAIPDGTPVFPNEPVITVVANIMEAQYIETALLACFNPGSLITTGTKRITESANGIPVMEFGARRGYGIDFSTEASKYAYIGGCVGTSNVLAGHYYDIPLVGTMAHSLVTESDTEYEAFLKFAKSNSNDCSLLVDTYDTLKSGVPNAIRIAKEYLIPNGYKLKSIRIDSGDLAYLSKMARKMLDEAGLIDTGICLSNGLNEYTIKDLLEQGACVNSFGVGDNITAPLERMSGVYKLVAIMKNNEYVSKIKVSNDSIKTINPGYQKVYRFYDKTSGYAIGDVVTLHDEIIPTDEYTLVNPTDEWSKRKITNYNVKELQVPIFKNGELVYKSPTLEEIRNYCKEEMNKLYPEVKRLLNPHKYYVDLSIKLLNEKKRLIMESCKQLDANPVKILKQ